MVELVCQEGLSFHLSGLSLYTRQVGLDPSLFWSSDMGPPTGLETRFIAALVDFLPIT